MAHGSSRGIRVTAVSVLRVLAGRYFPCASLAASTSPVSASAITQLEAVMSGTAGTPAVGWTTMPPLPSRAPPIGPSGAVVGREGGGPVRAGLGWAAAVGGHG